jgi:hypothetical protein
MEELALVLSARPAGGLAVFPSPFAPPREFATARCVLCCGYEYTLLVIKRRQKDGDKTHRIVNFMWYYHSINSIFPGDETLWEACNDW